MELEKRPKRAISYARKWTPKVIKKVVDGYIFPFFSDLVGGVINHFAHTPQILTKNELYAKGLALLQRAEKSILVVNTVGREDSLNYVSGHGSLYQKQYFEELFRTVQKNRHELGHLQVRRYMDLTDHQKCEEAISLLLYGSEVTIYDSNIPIEFLIRDDEEVLLGFPEERQLEHGVKIKSKDVAANLTRWIEGQSKLPHRSQAESHANRVPGSEATSSKRGSRTDGFTQAHELVKYIKKKRDNLEIIQARKEHREARELKTADDSLINAIDLLDIMEIDDPVAATKEAFDHFVNWHPHLYDEAETDFCFRSLADYIKNLSRKQQPTFLDLGCAHALGAKILIDKGIEYWGVEFSELATVAQRTTPKIIKSEMVRMLLETRPSRGLRDFFSRNPNTLIPPERFDVIACQGNTFDFFLGDLQKWFALTLFKSRLSESGILFLTQRSFRKGESMVTRTIPAPEDTTTITYKLNWRGDFVQVSVYWKDRLLRSVLQHPTKSKWLKSTCEESGFKQLEIRGNFPAWFGPRGGEPYEVFLFQRNP